MVDHRHEADAVAVFQVIAGEPDPIADGQSRKVERAVRIDESHCGFALGANSRTRQCVAEVGDGGGALKWSPVLSLDEACRRTKAV